MKRLTFFAGAVALLIVSTARAATFTVINTNDTGPGSLRQAIADASSGGPNTVAFNIPAFGVQTITPTTQLPSIGSNVILDGYTQPGASANTLTIGDNAVILIRIDGTNASPALVISGTNSTVRGLCIGHSTTLINVTGTNNFVTGNFLGIDADGATLLSGTTTSVNIDFGASGNTVGGTAPAQRNLVTGNGNGIFFEGGGITIQGNYFNLNAAGTDAVGSSGNDINGDVGVGILIGGSAAGAGNVFGNWSANAIRVGQGNTNFGFGNVTIQGNRIGTNAAGTLGLTGGQNGINIADCNGLLIGGNAAGAGNLISHCVLGIVMTGDLSGSVKIQGNNIGTDINGTGAIPNVLCGIQSFVGTSTSALIGGTNPGEANLIAFNGTQGVNLNAGTGWTISANSIHSNNGIGISLGGRSDLRAPPLPNDSCDGDEGPNHLQNYPVIQLVAVSNGSVTVGGILNSTANTTFRVEFFGNSVDDATGFGEGQTFLGATNVTTGANCQGSFNVSLPNPNNLPLISATATAPDGSTSEFSGSISGAGPLAVSRKFHNGVPFDVPLPLTGPAGVEPRGDTSNLQIVVTFGGPVTFDHASVISGTGMISDATTAGSQATITLSGVTDVQIVNLEIFGVNDGFFMGDVVIPIGVLLADANADHFVNSADATITRNRSGQNVNASNFRADYNLDGAINSADATIARNNSGRAIPAADFILLKRRLTQPFQVARPPESFR